LKKETKKLMECSVKDVHKHTKRTLPSIRLRPFRYFKSFTIVPDNTIIQNMINLK
jgi:hypothetical protein